MSNKGKILIIFLLFFGVLIYFNSSVFLMGDDFRYATRSAFNMKLPSERILNLYQVIETTIYEYVFWSTRYSTTFFITFSLLYGDVLFKILNPLFIIAPLLIATYVISNRFENKKVIIASIIICLLYFCISLDILDESVLWLTGAITYCWPVLSITIFIFILLNYVKLPNNIFVYLMVIFVSIISGSAVENYSISVILITIIILLYKKYTKVKLIKINYIQIICLFIAFLLSIMSPGGTNRIDVMISFSFFDIIGAGFLCFAQYIFYLNPIITLIILYFIIKLLLRNKEKKLLIANLVVLLPIIFICLLCCIPNLYNVQFTQYLSVLFMPYTYFGWSQTITMQLLIPLFYYLVVMIILVIDVFKISFKLNDFNLFVIFLFVVFPILALVPLAGATMRVYYLSFIASIILIEYIYIKYIDFNYKFFIILVLVCMINFIQKIEIVDYNIEVVSQRIRIMEDIENSEGDVILPMTRGRNFGNIDDPNTREYYEMKDYYNIPDHINIVFE